MHYTYYLWHDSAFNACVGIHWNWLAVVPDDDPLPLEDPSGVRIMMPQPRWLCHCVMLCGSGLRMGDC